MSYFSLGEMEGNGCAGCDGCAGCPDCAGCEHCRDCGSLGYVYLGGTLGDLPEAEQRFQDYNNAARAAAAAGDPVGAQKQLKEAQGVYDWQIVGKTSRDSYYADELAYTQSIVSGAQGARDQYAAQNVMAKRIAQVDATERAGPLWQRQAAAAGGSLVNSAKETRDDIANAPGKASDFLKKNATAIKGAAVLGGVGLVAWTLGPILRAVGAIGSRLAGRKTNPRRSRTRAPRAPRARARGGRR